MQWTKIRLWILAMPALVALAAGCGRAPKRTRSGPPQRILSLAPSVTEMLFALGLEDRLVGVTDNCDFPPAARRIPSTGRYGSPNAQKLVALQPDLAIGVGLETAPSWEVLRKLDIPLLMIEQGNLQDIYDAFLKVGKAAGIETRAQKYVGAMQARIEAIAARFKDLPEARRPKVLIEVSSDPLCVAGPRSYLGDLVRKAGGRNAPVGVDLLFANVNPQVVVAWNPDIIVVGHMTPGTNAGEQVAGRIGWSHIAAVKQGRVINDIPRDPLLRPGPRVVEVLEAFAEKFHREAKR